MSKAHRFLISNLLIIISLLLLDGCAAPVMTETVVGAAAAAGIYETRRTDGPPADTADQIAAHEDWCYSTLGDIECYAHPQNVPPDRLVNVDPQNRYPLTPRAYHDVVVEDQ